MLPSPVVERFDVVEQISLRVGPRTVVPCARSFFRLLKKLSVSALSQQLPLRLEEYGMICSMSRKGRLDESISSRTDFAEQLATLSEYLPVSALAAS